MHHITPFWDEKLKKNSPDPTPRRLRRLDFRVFGARPATPQCFSGVDAHAHALTPQGKKPGMDDENRSYATVVDLI